MLATIGNPAGLASDLLHQQGLNPAEVDKATYDEAKDKIAGGKELSAGVDLEKADVQAYSDICICYFWWRGVLYYRYQYCWQSCP